MVPSTDSLLNVLKFGEVVNQAMNKLASILHPEKFSDFSRVQVEVAVPWLYG